MTAPQTALLSTAHALHLTDSRLLDMLQDNGIISDNCLRVDEIANQDAWRAVEWLRKEFQLK